MMRKVKRGPHIIYPNFLMKLKEVHDHGENLCRSSMGHSEVEALFLTHEVKLIVKMNLIKYLLEKPVLIEHLVS